VLVPNKPHPTAYLADTRASYLFILADFPLLPSLKIWLFSFESLSTGVTCPTITTPQSSASPPSHTAATRHSIAYLALGTIVKYGEGACF